ASTGLRTSGWSPWRSGSGEIAGLPQGWRSFLIVHCIDPAGWRAIGGAIAADRSKSRVRCSTMGKCLASRRMSGLKPSPPRPSPPPALPTVDPLKSPLSGYTHENRMVPSPSPPPPAAPAAVHGAIDAARTVVQEAHHPGDAVCHCGDPVVLAVGPLWGGHGFV